LAPTTSYLDTYGDLAQLLNDGEEEEEAEEQGQNQEMDEEMSQDQDYAPSSSAQISYPSSPEAPSVSSSPFCLPATTPKSKATRKTKKEKDSGLVKDQRYWERRQKNNVASARSRKTRKERAMETEVERQKLELINRQLKEEIAQLTRLVDDHKRKFFAVFKK